MLSCESRSFTMLYGLVCAFRTFLQQLEVLICTYCTSKCLGTILYFGTQDRCKTSKHHWRAYRSSLYTVSTSNLWKYGTV